MNNSNRGQGRNPNQSRNYQSYRSDDRSSRQELGGQRHERNDWYDRDPMDERSGYRDEVDSSSSRRYGSSSRRPSSEYNSTYGSPSYDSSSRRDERYSRSDRDLDTFGSRSSSSASSDYYRPSDYDESANDYARSNERPREYDRQQSRGTRYDNDYSSNRMTQGQGAYGTSSQYGPSQRSSSSYGSGGYYGSDRPSSSYSSDSSTSERSSQFSGRGPKGFKRSDERIKEEVCEMLTRHSSIAADDIEVEVKDGEVILSGTVVERRMKHLAEDCAEHCYGVKDVTNNIRVKKSEEVDSSLSDRSEFGNRATTDRSASTSSASKKSTTGSTTQASSTNPNPNH